MKVELRKTIAKISLPVLLVLWALPVFGGGISFTATGQFCAGSGPCTTAPGTLTLGSGQDETFISVEPVTESIGTIATNLPLIDFVVSVGGTTPELATGSFTLDVTQTDPSAGSASITGGLSGNFALGSSTGTLTFSKDWFIIGGATYLLSQGNTFTFPTFAGPTHIIPLLVDVYEPGSATPEPRSLALTGTGFLFLAFLMAFRRRQTPQLQPAKTSSLT